MKVFKVIAIVVWVILALYIGIVGNYVIFNDIAVGIAHGQLRN